MNDSFSRANLSRLKQDRKFSANLCGFSLNFTTTWGLFSPREIDEGSKLLLEYVTVQDGQKVLDLGCGYGALGVPLGRQTPSGRVTMVDKDFVAVDYAQRNAVANHVNNARVMLSNGLQQLDSETFDLVVTNLPAKSGKELYYIMFNDVFESLSPGGCFYIVTITGLRRFVQRAFGEIFGNYEKLKQGKTYTVAVACKAP